MNVKTLYNYEKKLYNKIFRGTYLMYIIFKESISIRAEQCGYEKSTECSTQYMFSKYL